MSEMPIPNQSSIAVVGVSSTFAGDAARVAGVECPVMAVDPEDLGAPTVGERLAAQTVVWIQEVDGRGASTEAPAEWGRLVDAVVPSPAALSTALTSVRVLDKLPAGVRMIWATSPSASYPVFVGPGLLDAGWWPLETEPVCISDTAVAELFAHRLPKSKATLTVAPGESAKTMGEAERVLREMALAGVTRADHVAALGGGVVGDLAGLCAHLYQRGIPIVHVPTTVVAQVDSAIGGKSGVDLPEGKNYAGAFHLPVAVLADTDLLRTLPKPELAAGFVEALKTGLLAGGSLWERVRRVERLDAADLSDVVFGCVLYKCSVVAADERENGQRAALNLGHTIGHAIEAASNYERYRHGEAIGLGLLAALRLSQAAELRAEVEDILDRHGLPTRLDPAIELESILSALERDKKRTAAGVGFVLLSEPGRPSIGQLIQPALVRAAVVELRN